MLLPIIIAAGEAKAVIIEPSLENPPSNIYPASVLSKLPNARFYLTDGAAMRPKRLYGGLVCKGVSGAVRNLSAPLLVCVNC
jgi:hypothetical protein